jgi:transposase
MSKVSKTRAMVFCGVDVSAATLAVAVEQEDQPVEQREFANSAAGHKALIAWLRKRKAGVRVSLEATGIYSLDLALALDAAEGIEVAVLNPKAVNRSRRRCAGRRRTRPTPKPWLRTVAGCRSSRGGRLTAKGSGCALSAAISTV